MLKQQQIFVNDNCDNDEKSVEIQRVLLNSSHSFQKEKEDIVLKYQQTLN